MKSYPHFVIRKVRNGCIKFDNQWWIPQEITNRLNGLRFAFGVYVEGCYAHPVKRLDILCLWGSEEAYKAAGEVYNGADEESYNRVDEKDTKLLAPDGYLRQYWWHPIK